MDWIDDLIAGHPAEDLAIIDHDGRALDFGTLRRSVEDCADALTRAGVRPGDRVMAVAENSAVIVSALLAAARLRAWCVPVNARLTAPELDALRAHAAPRVTLFTTAASPDARAHADRLGATEGPRVLDAPLVMVSDPLAVPEPVAETPDRQVALMIYTSGTTGAPKGVMLSHQCLSFNAHSAARMRDMAPEDQLLLAIPGTHIMALSTGLLSTLSAGASVRLLPRFSIEGVLDGLAKGASVFSVVPQVYRQLLSRIEAEGGLNAPRLRIIGSGGAPLDPSLKARVEAAFGLPLQNGYGLTEAGPGITSTTQGPPRRDGSVGYRYPGCELRIADPGPDGIGELQQRGPNVMLGYYRAPEATAAAITPDGFLRTGDLARIDEDGAVHLAGRGKELIIRSGFNVYPSEVETVLLACPGVLQAAVAGRAVEGNEEVLAFVTTDGSTDAETLAALLRARLTAYKRPQEIHLVEAMPMNNTGKILKHALVAALPPAAVQGA